MSAGTSASAKNRPAGLRGYRVARKRTVCADRRSGAHVQHRDERDDRLRLTARAVRRGMTASPSRTSSLLAITCFGGRGGQRVQARAGEAREHRQLHALVGHQYGGGRHQRCGCARVHANSGLTPNAVKAVLEYSRFRFSTMPANRLTRCRRERAKSKSPDLWRWHARSIRTRPSGLPGCRRRSYRRR